MVAIYRRWLFELVNNDFFHVCEKHKHAKKSDCTFFCTTCGCKPFCQHCLKDHEAHEVLQIRRYVYHDVVKARLSELAMEKDALEGMIKGF